MVSGTDDLLSYAGDVASCERAELVALVPSVIYLQESI